MPAPAKNFRLWSVLLLVSGVPRILAAFLLPNAFGDAYAYIREVEVLSAKLNAGTFSLTDLYGFWLPLYQLICAVVSVLVGHPYYVAKVVSALFGVGICLLVYELSLRLTGSRTAALLTFALIALSPLHIFNSASAMTDIPHAFFVVAGVYFILQKSWLLAAVMIALAGLTRVDSWMLIIFIPALQFIEERRVSPVACAILLFPPLFWFYVSWKATGDWLACFRVRKQYMDWLLTVNPSLATFSLKGVARDAGALLLSTDLAVLAACLVGAWLALRHTRFSAAAREPANTRDALVVNLFFLTFLSFIVFAYLTHKQPIIFPRYGLINFALGLPLLPWTFLKLTGSKPHWRRRLWHAVIVVCVLNASIQLAYSIGFINREHTFGTVATHLRAQFDQSSGARIFSDEGTVVAVSGIPPENFLSSADAPTEREGFVNFLKEKNVVYLVFIDRIGSTPAKLFPELKEGAGNELFRPVLHARSEFLPADVWLYKVHELKK
jgi:hypothetical protein